jgi:hypothetical protein
MPTPSALPRSALQRFAVLSLLLLLPACNRPAQEAPPDNLATFVAATLASQPSLTAQLPTALPTWTLPAPFTTDTPTPEPSQTPEPTIETTPSSTPLPLAPDDPRLGLNLSSPDYTDDFAVSGTWFQYPADFEDATIRWEDGRLRASDNLVDGFLWWSTTSLQVEDLYAEVSVETDDCAGRDAYGMAIRVGGENFDRGYTLEITCDGQYRVRKFISEETPRILMDWTPALAIRQGSGASNRIGILSVGEELHFVANGEVLNSQPVVEDDYTDGALGLFASAAQTPGLTVYFDDFALWYPSP